MKVKITESELINMFKDVFDKDNIIIETDLTKGDVKSLIKQEIKDFLTSNRSPEFENKIKDILKKQYKNDKEFEKHITTISKNVLIQLYKNLWLRRSFWFDGIN